METRDVHVGMLVRFPQGRGKPRALGKVVDCNPDTSRGYRWRVDCGHGEDGPIIREFKSKQLHRATIEAGATTR